MSDYPPGSFGWHFDHLDERLAKLERETPWFLRRRIRKLRRELAESRRKMRERLWNDLFLHLDS